MLHEKNIPPASKVQTASYRHEALIGISMPFNPIRGWHIQYSRQNPREQHRPHRRKTDIYKYKYLFPI